MEQLNLKELFQAATKAYRQKKYKLTIRLYQRVIRYFPLSKWLYAAWYNLALAYEDNGQCRQAIPYYKRVRDTYPEKKKLARHSLFRIGACYRSLKEWSLAAKTYDQLLSGEPSINDRIDALAWYGEARFRQGQHRQAIPSLKLAVQLHLGSNTGKKRPIRYTASMAQYYLGRIHDLRFRKRRFHLPQKRLRQDLEYKAKELLSAQQLYLRTLHLRHADWAMAALHRIGEMYEQMYQDMMEAPTPPELSAEEKKIYREMLRQRISILLRKAIIVYERNLLLASYVGVKASTWKKKSLKRLQKAKQFYRKNFGPLSRPTTRPTTQPTTQPTTRPTPAFPSRKKS